MEGVEMERKIQTLEECIAKINRAKSDTKFWLGEDTLNDISIYLKESISQITAAEKRGFDKGYEQCLDETMLYIQAQIKYGKIEKGNRDKMVEYYRSLKEE
jgi:hypothetical protein